MMGADEEELKKIGLWVDKKPHEMRLGFCSRSAPALQHSVLARRENPHARGHMYTWCTPFYELKIN